ncbi:hypothetical protein BXZ70DRAFT_663104 [Cristinia sonorae]|uniref:Uncharacterized protein n=1 Tax=Cristinia sonorae TaxID=1940300 RepID=A0A8K0UDM2_9AGAR|nr:hypothetical protein BXZ70DRAFT_663104 [Cristinia sonorae]
MSSTIRNSSDIQEAMAALKQLEQDGMTPEVKADVYSTMAGKIDSSRADIVTEVEQLAYRAVATDEAFESIRTQLAVVDQNEYKDQFGRPVPRMQPTWIGYQRRYSTLLWQSRDAASVTTAYLRDFTDVILPLILEPNSSHQDNVKDLQAFINRRKPIVPFQDDFKRLQADVASFTESFSTFADAQGAEITAEIERLKESIRALNRDLQDADELVTQMAIALGLTIGATAAGVGISMASLGPLAPTAIIAILIAGVAAAIGTLSTLIVAMVRKANIEREITEKQRQIDALTIELKLLGKVKNMLDRAAEEAGEMFWRLDSFTHIWDRTVEDARIILNTNLENVHSDPTVRARIQLIKTSYEGVIPALGNYATLIRSDLQQRNFE